MAGVGNSVGRIGLFTFPEKETAVGTCFALVGIVEPDALIWQLSMKIIITNRKSIKTFLKPVCISTSSQFGKNNLKFAY
jgi:hypothetical protein